MPLIQGRNSPGPGELQNCILDACGVDGHILGKDIAQSEVAPAIESIVAELKHNYPTIREWAIDSMRGVEAACRILTNQFHLPECRVCHVPQGKLTERAIDLIEVLAPRFPAISKFFLGRAPEDFERAQVIDVSTSIFQLENLLKKKQIVEVFRFVEKLLEHQKDCVLTPEEKADPLRPACGLYNRMSLVEFYRVMQSPGSQLLLAANNDDCFGQYIYFGRGMCASEDREFFDRALTELEKHQPMILQHFGEKFDRHNCSSVYGAYVSNKVREDTELDGGGLGRGQIYGALSYHAFNELQLNSRWCLGWVRTKPNPNIAENAHLRQGFLDTGIVMNYEEGSDKFQLKLLLINLDQMFNPDKFDTRYVREQIKPHFWFMQHAAYNTGYTNYDTRPPKIAAV